VSGVIDSGHSIRHKKTLEFHVKLLLRNIESGRKLEVMLRGLRIIGLIVMLVNPLSTLAEPIVPANPAARPDAARLLSYLDGLTSKDSERVLSGQNIASVNQEFDRYYEKYVTGLQNKTGEVPAILGVGYAWEHVVPERIRKANVRLIEHWRKGGIVTISMSPNNPFTERGLKDFSIGKHAYSDILTPGTVPYERWRNTLSGIAYGLEELRDAGVVVLWRPLHEMNGDFFWWSYGENGERVAASDFIALWRDMFRYFSVDRNLDNLLWVYAPSVHSNEKLKPVLYYYPGDDFVDTVGLDFYGNSFDGLNQNNSYSDLVATGKPIGLTEVGPAFWFFAHPRGDFDTRIVIDAIRTTYPEIRYFSYWHGWSSFFLTARLGIVENAYAEEMLNDPWVVTLDNLSW
jgi:mannan endo-1,4-beta-mannosidase